MDYQPQGVDLQLFESQLQIAVNHHKAGELTEAEAAYRRVLALTPEDSRILHVLGVLCQQSNRRDLAIELIQKAIHLHPDFPEALNNLSVSLNEIGRFEEAIACCTKAIQLRPDYAAAHINLGNAFRETGQLDHAITVFNKAAQLQPPTAVLLSNLAAAHHDRGDFDAGIVAATEAPRIDPRSPQAHFALAQNLKAVGQIAQALQSYDAAIQLKPGDASLHSSRVYCLQFSGAHDSAAIQKELAEWNDRHARALIANIKPHDNDPSPDRRLRIGYVSPNFRAHPLSFFMLPILRNHHRQQVEVFCYSDVLQPDAITQQCRQQCDHWRTIVGHSDQDVAEMIRADRIDILIDLTLHMARNRLLMFARKPAPVQVTWLGYPGASGLATMDYRLTDAQLDPPGDEDQNHTEKPMRLPHSFWYYDPLAQEPEVNALPARSADRITFGCLNSFYKINMATLELFASVLHAVPHSRLLMLCPTESARNSTLKQFHELGIDSAKIEFTGFRPRPEYLRTYHRMDISLDVLPYNGHTTTMDSLWMGVPVITQVGSTIVGRAGLSILTNAGLPELIARSSAEFIKIATQISSDLIRLDELRSTMRERITRSSLMDAALFIKGLESAYQTMWRNYVVGLENPHSGREIL